jgi:hypothetical protein
LAKKTAKVYHSLYSSTEQLQMTLGFMFISFGINNEKSFHTLPLQSLHLLSPSIILPLQTLRLDSLVNLIRKTYRIAQQIFEGKARKSGTKSRGFLQFVPLRRLYAVLFVPLFCRNAGDYEKRPDCIT